MEYEQSDVTKMINTLQTREFYNEMFKKAFEDDNEIFTEELLMSEKAYNRLKERYFHRSPFVSFFNPSIELREYRFRNAYYVGYIIKRDNGVWVSIYYNDKFKYILHFVLCIKKDINAYYSKITFYFKSVLLMYFITIVVLIQLEI